MKKLKWKDFSVNTLDLLLGDVLNYEQPTRYIVASENYSDKFSTPVLTAGKSFILGYTDETENIYSNLPAIIFDDFTADTKFVDFPFKVKSSAMKILTCDPKKFDLRYIFYLMQTLKVDTEQHKRYWISKFANIQVNLPPLPVQKRIAEILDAADALRKKDQELLKKYDELAQAIFIDMFGDPVKNEKGWEVVTLEKITSKLGDGLHGTPLYADDGTYYFINGNNLEDGKILVTATTKKLNQAEYLKHKKELDETTMLVSINGTIGKVAFYQGEPIVLGKSACYFNVKKESVSQIYLYSILKSPYFLDYALSNATGSTIMNVSLKTMRTFPVPLPPIALQLKYENIFNHLESLKAIQNQSISIDPFSSLLHQAFSGELVS